jgi:hypothetical protein
MIKAAAELISDEYSTSELIRNPVCFEDPVQSVNIAIDDVGVKRQSAKRRKCPADPDQPTKRKYTHTTVVRIDQAQKHYSSVASA